MTATSYADETDDPRIPPWLARHVHIGFDSDDVAALVNSIESSQDASPAVHLPAELLLHVLEFVPVDYLLHWRLVCHGFRDAVDGRIAYHHLRRVELIGHMGSRHSQPMEHLDDEQYDNIHLLHAHFGAMEDSSRGMPSARPIWARTHALFHINHAWFHAFREIGGAAGRNGHIVEQADTPWLPTLDRLELRREEEGFGTLRWCIRLDHAVLDLDFPLEKGRSSFAVDVNLHKKTIRVAWREMLFSFLKTEAALRRELDAKRDAKYTFNHTEDCLRYIRRQRLHSTLDPNNRIDRHIKWSLRLLTPLFGTTQANSSVILADVENEATSLLLLLRREAAMSTRHIKHLQTLAAEYKHMQREVSELDQAFEEFKHHFSLSGLQLSISLPTLHPYQVARNPIAWPDELKATIEGLVGKWKSQKKVFEQMQALLTASNVALTVPEDTFDDLGSDF